MAVYKFKLFIEDNEDIYREIEILSGQTFDDFHHAIQDAYKFDKKHAAAFFVSDDYWRKDQEITLREEDLPLDAEELKKNVSPKKLMSKTKIAKYIDSPRQRFMYVFDPAIKWSFCIELMKILPDNPKGTYPTCVKSIGNAPKQYKQAKMATGELSPDLLMASMVDDPEVANESEIYQAIKNDTVGIDEGDLNHLEAEEGEDAVEEDYDMLGDDDDDVDNDNEIPEGYGRDED
jgi:hypothetical protein